MVQAYSKIESTLEVLKEGKIILIPTDTVWTLSCDINNKEAVSRIHEIRGGRDFPSIIMVSSLQMLRKHVRDIPPKIETLLNFHQHPLTIIYDTPINIPDNLLNEDGSIAIHISKDPTVKFLCEAINGPLLGTTANKIEQPIPANFGQINSDILQAADKVLLIRQGEKKKSLPSVIARMGNQGELDFIRE